MDVSPTSITFRPAQAADIPAIAHLIVQLYAAELPGALTAPEAQQAALVRFTLEAQPVRALRHRYVLCDAQQRLVATGMLQLPNEPAYERAPDGTLRMAMTLLGYAQAARLLVTVARSLIGIAPQRSADTVLLHSIVVDEKARGQGLGRSMVAHLEQVAAVEGYIWATLQVLANNTAAYRLYQRMGYQEMWRTPPWMGLLSWRSLVMRKRVA